MTAVQTGTAQAAAVRLKAGDLSGVDTARFAADAASKTVPADGIDADWMALDIGSKSAGIFAQALAAAGEEENALKSGVEMVLRQTRDALTKMGVEEIDPQGKPFDAELMNAVMQGTAEEGEPGRVCMVLQKGYKLGERVIRHAMVKVVAG